MKTNNNNGNSGCFSHEDLVSYLYGEILEADRARLDLHLAECRNCTEGFAALSESRFSVYEWKRDEFEALATPEIVGPWKDKKNSTVVTVSWIERIKQLITANPSVAFAAAALIMLAVVVWLGFLNFRGVADQDQASQPKNLNEQNPVVTSPDKVVPSPEVAVVEPKQKSEITTRKQKTESTGHPFRTEVATVANHVRTTQHNQRLADGGIKKTQIARRIPNLSGIEEDEDTTIRLADLFAEVGSDNENN